MAERHRRIAVFARQKDGERFSDDIRSTDDDRARTRSFNVHRFEEHDDAVRRTRKRRITAYNEFSDIDRMKTVDIFFGRNRKEYFMFVDVLRKRQLHENTVDALVAVEFSDKRKQFRFACIFGKLDGTVAHARFRKRVPLGAHV